MQQNIEKNNINYKYLENKMIVHLNKLDFSYLKILILLAILNNIWFKIKRKYYEKLHLMYAIN